MWLTDEGQQEQIDFLKEWPIERIEAMSLEEYTNLDKDTAFVYWLEAKSEHAGSIWGGSAYKFGIFRRRNTESNKGDERYKTDGSYAWQAKYGNTRDEAFHNVKSIILNIAQFSHNKQFEKIDDLDLGNSVKWKIAFLYNASELLPIFKKKVLMRIAESHGLDGAKKKEISELQRFIIDLKPETASTLEFAEALWTQFNLDNFFFVVDKFLKQAQTDNLKKKGFPKTFKELDVKVSFGAGTTAKIPWIALLRTPNTVTEGIYPVYLYYKEANTLVLAYGVSETAISENQWNLPMATKNINDWYTNEFGKSPDRYGSSFYKASYNLDEEIDPEQLESDFDEIISQYKAKEFSKPPAVHEKKEEYRPKKYWIVAPGEGAEKWEEFYIEGIIGLGWDEMGDLSKYSDRESMSSALLSLYPDGSKSPKNNSLALWEFSHEMQLGDILISKKGINEYLGYGEVVSDYYFDDVKSSYKQTRKVDWKKKGSWPEDVHKIVLKTLTDITKYTEYVDRLKRLIGIEQEEIIPKSINYWWLNANPRYWRMEDFEVGQEQSYTTHNEKGNKRGKFQYFHQAKPGDLIIGYESSPTKKAVAIFEVTKGAHIDEDDGAEKITFKIQKFLPDPIPWEDLKSMPELINCEVLKSNQGSLFKLEKNEYDAIANRDAVSQYEEYSISNSLKELFIEEEELEKILLSLNYKKNIILQGPPGTGKTFMAKRLAYLLLEEKDSSRVEMVQFHQSYAYEDFIQGYRPTDDGSFKLENGVFYRFCKKAQADPDKNYIFIIDEINRGNLSKIFGELMLLIEADKRGKDFGIALTYSHSNTSKFYIPDNVYIIGTMNTADRSLAIVDYALRRRFAFINLMPNLNNKFKSEMINNGVDEGIVERILTKIDSLNKSIRDDSNLGKGFQIGHSYFCNFTNNSGDEDWYQFIVEHEIAPLLEEYWFDNESRAQTHIQSLLK